MLITKETGARRIKGVHIEETDDQYMHGQFVNNTSIVVQAERRYVDHVLDTFWLMGQAFGLYIKKTRIKFVYISLEPMPKDIWTLDWDFESEDNWSKLPDFHIGLGILAVQLLNHLEVVLEKWLHDAHLNPYSILVWVTLPTRFMESTFWYYIQLWLSNFFDMDIIDKEILCFILKGQDDSKRLKVEYVVLLRPKYKRGFWLKSIKA